MPRSLLQIMLNLPLRPQSQLSQDRFYAAIKKIAYSLFW